MGIKKYFMILTPLIPGEVDRRRENETSNFKLDAVSEDMSVQI